MKYLNTESSLGVMSNLNISINAVTIAIVIGVLQQPRYCFNS